MLGISLGSAAILKASCKQIACLIHFVEGDWQPSSEKANAMESLDSGCAWFALCCTGLGAERVWQLYAIGIAI